MPSFDIVSEVDIQEVRNAVDQATRELRTRFDFKNIEASIGFDNEKIQLAAPEEFQVKQLLDILQGKLVARGVDSRSLDAGPVEGSGKQQVQSFGLKQGIDRETAKKIVKLIKDGKLKVQSQIQGEQVRVTGKKRDDLQGAMTLIKEAKLEIALDFNNFRD